MMDTEKLLSEIEAYKKALPNRWNGEKYKWEAIQRFQTIWDVNASDFAAMLKNALSKTGNLLSAAGKYPRDRIIEFSASNPDAVRAMFINLFDETQEVTQRVSSFLAEARELNQRFKDGKSDFQDANTISTYLWLKYPDKYYIYKRMYINLLCQTFNYPRFLVHSRPINNMIQGVKLYDEISNYLKSDSELAALLFNSLLTDSCYPDKSFHTLALDFGYYIAEKYKKAAPSKADEPEGEELDNSKPWFPAHYSPNISVEQWVELLKEKSVFGNESLAIMKRFKDYGGAATCSQLAKKYGEKPIFYNSVSVQLAKRIINTIHCPAPKDVLSDEESKNSRYWPVLYMGKYTNNKTEGLYIWKLRDELSAALDKIDLSAVPLYADNIENESSEEDKLQPYTRADFLNEVYLSKEKADSLFSLIKNKKNIILQGAPGVGKSFSAKRIAYAMMGAADDSKIQMIQFHQSYSYDDFIIGYKPSEDGFQLQEGVFYKFCTKAHNDPGHDYFFIIDEINRGNMSKIFGELLLLIEKDYRDTEIALSCGGFSFRVPQNLYIIGLMNTADRSLAVIDYALRRRFSFFDMESAFDQPGFLSYEKTVNSPVFDKLISIIKEINDDIRQDNSLGKGFCIGHSFFCNINDNVKESLEEIVNYDIIPLLEEYWFDDTSKVNQWTRKLREALNE